MRTVVILSGGVDSAVVLYRLLHEKHECVTLSFNYGQRHGLCELHAAHHIARAAHVEHHVLDVPALSRNAKGSALVDHAAPMPHGHYTDDSQKATVVPGRNLLMLAHAYSFALGNGCHAVAFGAHAGDHAIYPDCRPRFFEALRDTFEVADYRTVRLVAPFLHGTKADVVKVGARLGVPFDLTWTCYDPVADSGLIPIMRHCGKCGACVERREAFQLAGVQDPTEWVQA